MKHIFFALLLVGCIPKDDPAPMQTTTSAIDRQLIQTADAMARYRDGRDAEPTEQGKAAFRRECVVHETDREILLDQMREHAQIHVFAWREWYRVHCDSIESGRGPIIDSSTGHTVDARACDADAGAPPGFWYIHTPEENLAQAQRDACERAQ
jgi:hypothetical protein